MIGELTNVSVAGMLRLLSNYQQTGVFRVTGKDGEGEIYIEDGILVGASSPKKTLQEEVLRLLLLPEGNFQFEAKKTLPANLRRGELEEVESVILEAARRQDVRALTEFLPPSDTVLQLAPIFGRREQLRLNLRREEWNFLTKVNGEDPMRLLMENSELPKNRAVQVIYGLLAAGLLRKIRYRIPQVLEIAVQELGNMGEALVRETFRKLKLDPARMHMRQLIALLNEMERSITLLLGPTRAAAIVGRMWEGAKR